MILSKDLKTSIYLSAVKGELGTNNPNECPIKIESTLEDIPFDIPANWVWVRLLDIIESKPKNGISPKGVEYETNTRNLTLTATTSGYFKEDYKYIVLDDNVRNKYLLKHGDLLIQRSNSIDLVGTSCIYTGEDDAFVYPDIIMRMRVKPQFSTKFVDFVLKSPLVREYYRDNAKGTQKSMPKINQKTVSNTPIPLPPYEEQERILLKLDELMRLVDEYAATENKIENLETEFHSDLIDSVLLYAMEGKFSCHQSTDIPVEIMLQRVSCGKKIKTLPSDDINIPSHWCVVPFKSIAEIYTGNSISAEVKKSKYTDLPDGYDYIGTKDVGFDHKITYDNGVRIPFSEEGFRYAPPQSVLLCIEGGSAGRKIAITNKKVCFGNKLCCFYSECIYPEFLYYYLQSNMFLNEFKDNISGIIGGVSINKIRKMGFPLPPLEEQIRIANKLNGFFAIYND